MGAWAYCRSCGNGLNRSRASQVAREAHDCPACDYRNKPNIDLADALEDLENRVKALEEKDAIE